MNDITPAALCRVTSDEGQTEIELFESLKEREAYDNLADLYTIILATEHLEKAYARDAITQKEVSKEIPLRKSCRIHNRVFLDFWNGRERRVAANDSLI